MGDVEVDAILAAFFHLGVDGACHDVARREFGHGMILIHECFTGTVPKHAPVPAHRFGNEKRIPLRMKQGSGMKLHELEIGHGRPGPVRHGNTVTGRNGGIGCVQIDAA